MDILGGNPAPIPQSEHRRPPMLHDIALQSTIQVQVGTMSSGGEASQVAAKKLYRHSLVAAMNNLVLSQHAQTLACSKKLGLGVPQEGGESSSAAPPPVVLPRGQKVPGPPPAHLLPHVMTIPPKSSAPFDPRSWSAARRVLLSSCVVRSRSLWCIDSVTVTSVIDQWLLPTYAQRAVYLQVRSTMIVGTRLTLPLR